MNLSELIEWCKGVTYKGMPCVKIVRYNPRNSFTPCPEGYVYMSIWINVTDVDGGKPTQIESGGITAIKDLEGASEMSNLTHIRDTIMSLEMHEVNETFALKGERIFDPHANRETMKVVVEETKQEAA